MARDPRYDPLFEPEKIGPVTAPNRFYQVPHCSGMGQLRPQMLAELRGVKAEGGWGVVCTEYCSIHASSDQTPYPSASLRDDDDVRNLRLMTDKLHAQGSRTLPKWRPDAARWRCAARSPATRSTGAVISRNL